MYFKLKHTYAPISSKLIRNIWR